MKKLPLFLALAVACPALQAAPAKAPQKLAPKAKTGAPQWITATHAQRQAVAAVIKAQLEAFKRNDWEKAATYQATNLRQMFGTTSRFRAVILGNYPQFANYSTVSFDRARALGDHVEMTIRLTGKDGVKLRAIYMMVKEKSGYKVAGVQGGAANPASEGGKSSYV
jgi:hypothetical protein